VLVGLRATLRHKNLFDTAKEPAINLPPMATPDPRFLSERTLDGIYNDLAHPEMGMAGSRFGRNVPLEQALPEDGASILTPNPRLVGRQL